MGTLAGVPATQDSTDIPVIASSVSASSGIKANAVAAASLPAQFGATAYLTGFQVTASGATAASVATLTLSGVLGGSVTFSFVFPAGATTAAQPLVASFYPAIPAAAANTGITLALPAGGAGNTSAAVSLQGFYL